MCICRSITLDNQLVVLATTAADAGRYHVEAVNDMTGENATSPAVYLSISGEEGLLLLIFFFKSFERKKCKWTDGGTRLPGSSNVKVALTV